MRVPSSGLAELPQSRLDAAIAALWRDAQPRALTRVATIEAAIGALAEGSVDSELAADAIREAHKLAGALGTFGMPAGTDRARAIERRLEDGATTDDAPVLGAEAQALRAIVEAGPGTP
jgi:HPt (histidine-containing phosphotransfer) domain-containing protein